MIKTINTRAHTRVTLRTSLVFFLVFLSSLLAPIISMYSVEAAGLSFGYGSGQDVARGMIVSIDKDDTSRVVQGHVNNADYVVGIVVDQESSSVVFDNDDDIYVATDGTVQVFVSTIGGDIADGDLITVSTIGGVGRKQEPGLDGQKIVGVAKRDFSANSPNARTVALENAGEVAVGLIDIEVLVGEPAIGDKNEEGVNVLVRIGRQIAGKPVSFSQVLVTASVVIVAFVISGAMLYGAIRGSFTSIGRNPLSAKTIYRGMIRASLISLSVMMLGIVGGYVVLLL